MHWHVAETNKLTLNTYLPNFPTHTTNDKLVNKLHYLKIFL